MVFFSDLKVQPSHPPSCQPHLTSIPVRSHLNPTKFPSHLQFLVSHGGQALDAILLLVIFKIYFWLCEFTKVGHTYAVHCTVFLISYSLISYKITRNFQQYNCQYGGFQDSKPVHKGYIGWHLCYLYFHLNTTKYLTKAILPFLSPGRVFMSLHSVWKWEYLVISNQ